MCIQEFTKIFVTLGGEKPGLGYYDVIAGQFRKWITLPEGQSIYSIDYKCEGKTIWTGTRAGRLYCTAVQFDDEPNNELFHDFGADDGILDIALIKSQLIAVAHTSGKCHFRSLIETETSRQLDTRGRTVYALFNPDQEHLAGLTNDKLLVWDIDGNLVFVTEIPEPGNWSSLIKPMFFNPTDLWLWPDGRGRLVTYNHIRRQIETYAAHESQFYGIAESGIGLITAGFEDNILRIWNKEFELLNEIYVSASQIISAFSWENMGANILFTRATGECGVYKLLKNQLHLVADSDLRDCRLIFSSGRQVLETAIAGHKKQKAAEIAKQITNHPGRPAMTEPLHKELIDLGYENISLLLRAEQARINGDPVEELGFYHRLFRRADAVESKMAESLLRYGSLLEMLWQVRSADTIFGLLDQFDVDDAIGQRQNSMKQKLQALDHRTAIINPGEISIGQILKASCITREPVMGRFIIKVLESYSQTVPEISPSQYVESFKRSGIEVTEPQFLAVEVFDNNTVTEREAVVLGASQEEVIGLELCLLFTHIAGRTRIVPATVFNADRIPGNDQERAESLLQQYSSCKDSRISHPWLAQVHEVSDHVLRQFITVKKSQSNSFL